MMPFKRADQAEKNDTIVIKSLYMQLLTFYSAYKEMYFKLQPQTNKKINFKHRTILLNIRNTLLKKIIAKRYFQIQADDLQYKEQHILDFALEEIQITLLF